jgi:hypothetical protein
MPSLTLTNYFAILCETNAEYFGEDVDGTYQNNCEIFKCRTTNMFQRTNLPNYSNPAIKKKNNNAILRNHRCYVKIFLCFNVSEINS